MKNNQQQEYFDLYNEMKTPYNLVKEAYEATEEKWIERHGARKYKNYRTFRTMKSRYQAIVL